MTIQTQADRRDAIATRRRDRTTRQAVIVADRIADWSIRVGGMMVIIAVFAIMAFLVAVVWPLFAGARVDTPKQFQVAGLRADALSARIDEYRTLGVQMARDGRVTAFHLGSGAPVAAPAFDLAGRTVTAFASTLSGDDIVLGLDDGTVRFGRIMLKAEVLPGDQRPAGLRQLDAHDATDGQAVYSTIPGGQVRRMTVAVALDDPQKIADGAAIVALDMRLGGTVERPTKTVVSADAAGAIRLSLAETKVNLLTRRATTTLATTNLPALPAGTKIAAMLVTDKADQVYVGEASGTVFRFDTRDFDKPTLAETASLMPRGEALATMQFLIGEQSLVIGGASGTVDVFFKLPSSTARTTDGYAMVRAHRLAPQSAGIVAMAPSQRGKMFVTADARGGIWLRHATSEQTLLKLAPLNGHPAIAVLLAPREDAVVAIDAAGGVTVWPVEVPHPETTLATIFGKVWYEGYGGPTYTWQSSSGTDSFEPKFSLVPLIFGTLKAAFYSLLFAVPVALMAAIFTSEFVHPNVRATVKPVMEMMASLPSVVLGFLAALIIAPIVETWITGVLLAFLALPLTLIAAAYMWQLLPESIALQYGGVPKFALMFVALALGMLVAYVGGGAFEKLVFYGSFSGWASGNVGGPAPFLTVMLWPLAFAGAMVALTYTIGDQIEDAIRSVPRFQGATWDIGRWVVLLLGSLLVAWLVASLLTQAGVDPRGGVVGTYVQRNTLVVGFAMGFAVIPIIYTIAEDALNSVPEHLRAASLACGATPWQTAIRVILPTAFSGVFAAIMIGMGRAVGETMIVVMAAGNTPVLEWNIFNGLRALSANIAVELPEAVRDSSLYRMLFLAALSLFVMTFVVNTAAELIRLRFRKRAAQL
jgi:phosphate transport system permease protein